MKVSRITAERRCRPAEVACLWSRSGQSPFSPSIFSSAMRISIYFFQSCRIFNGQTIVGLLGLSSEAMRNRVRLPRLSLVALMAIAVIFWGTPVVTACTAEKTATSACCCCAQQMSSESGCCSKAEHRLETTPPSPERVPGTSFTGTRVPCATCVCSQPTSPARRSERNESQTTEESTFEAVLGPVQICHSDCASFAPRSFALFGPTPFHTPLYLRVERLII
jgi:hypothetical protein